MASLQNPLSLQLPPSSSSSLRASKPLFAFSFASTTFNPLRLKTLTSTSTSTSTARPRGGSLGARMTDTAASRYASALADVANSTDTLEATSSDVEKISKIFSQDEVYQFFANPIIDIEKKRSVLDEIATASGLQPYTSNFLNILIDTKRIEVIRDIVKEFEVVYNRITDTELAVVSSVVMLENEHLAQIAKGVQRLTGAKNVRIKTVLDPSLVAGFTIRYGNGGSRLVDMSVKKQLEELAATLDLSDIQLAV